MAIRDISRILQPANQTLGGTFGMNNRNRNVERYFNGEPNFIEGPSFPEVPDITNILNQQIDPQGMGGAIMPGADIPSFGPGRMLGDDFRGIGMRGEDSGTGVGPFGPSGDFDLGPGQTSDLEDFQNARDFWRETGNWPDTGDQSIDDVTVDETQLPLELQEFTFSDALTLPPEYISPELEDLPEFYGMEYDPYARAPTMTTIDDIANMERPAGVSDEDWQGYKQNQFNAFVGSAESQTFDQWKYGFGDVRGRAQELQEPAIRTLERSVRRSLSGAIENPNVRRQTERATLGGFGMGLEDVSGAARGQALSEYGGDFRRAFETKERNYIADLQQTGLENVATLQEARINADRALKTYYQEEQRRYDEEYANWFADTQEDLANWYAQIVADEQEAGTTTIIRTEGE